MLISIYFRSNHPLLLIQRPLFCIKEEKKFKPGLINRLLFIKLDHLFYREKIGWKNSCATIHGNLTMGKHELIINTHWYICLGIIFRHFFYRFNRVKFSVVTFIYEASAIQCPILHEACQSLNPGCAQRLRTLQVKIFFTLIYYPTLMNYIY